MFHEPLRATGRFSRRVTARPQNVKIMPQEKHELATFTVCTNG
jgi:hypothetical protein